MLLALGQEQKFEVKFVDLEERTVDGEAQCLVQLSTLPVAVCYGVGTDQVKYQMRLAENSFKIAANSSVEFRLIRLNPIYEHI